MIPVARRAAYAPGDLVLLGCVVCTVLAQDGPDVTLAESAGRLRVPSCELTPLCDGVRVRQCPDWGDPS